MEEAHELLKEEGRKVTDVCYNVGFKNRSHFATAFKKYYGYTPGKKGGVYGGDFNDMDNLSK